MYIQGIKIGVMIMALAVFAGVAYFGGQLADRALQQWDRDLDLRAINDCAVAYHQETANALTGVTTVRPMEQQVRECAWQKGVKWDGVWSDLTTASTKKTTVVR